MYSELKEKSKLLSSLEKKNSVWYDKNRNRIFLNLTQHAQTLLTLRFTL